MAKIDIYYYTSFCVYYNFPKLHIFHNLTLITSLRDDFELSKESKCLVGERLFCVLVNDCGRTVTETEVVHHMILLDRI